MSHPAEASTPRDAATPNDAADGGTTLPRDAGEAEASRAHVVFGGNYSGESTVEIALEGFPRQSHKSSKAKLRVSSNADGSLKFQMLETSGKGACTVVGHAAGHTVTLDAGQSCAHAPMTATLRSGKAVVAGDNLVLDAEFTLELSLSNRAATGTMRVHFEGSRD